MDAPDTSLLESGQRVGLAVADYAAELADFPPLQAADTDRAELVAAIVLKAGIQDTPTDDTTVAKDTARELMATTTDTLSARAVGYALATNQLDLKQAFTLPYADVRYGEATEDVNHVRALVARVQALPAQVRKDYRLTDAIVQAPADAADLFEKADAAQTTAKAAPRLATVALPQLLTRLSATLLLMKTLLKGQRTDTDPDFQWPALYDAFLDANKRRKTSGQRRAASKQPRKVKKLLLHATTGQPVQLDDQNYGPAYTLTVENRAASPLLLWMAQKDGAKTTPLPCPAGAITTLTRVNLGPETARYLLTQFGDAAGGEATIVVRRVVAG